MSEEVQGAPAAPETPVAANEAAPVEVIAEGAQSAQNESEQASDTPAEKPADTPEQAAKREGRRFEKKLGTAIRRAAEATARAELLERQIEELRQPAAPKDTSAPKLENFSDIEEYATAKAEYAKQQTLKELTTKQQTEAQKREVETLTSGWEEKASRADGKYDDFDEVVGDLKPTSPFAVAIMEAENGEDIAYHLGKNPKEAARIAALPPRAQFREIGKLEAKLLAEPPKPKTPSKAPAPIAPLGGKSGVSNDTPSDSDDIATWMRKENARMKRMAGA